MLTKFFCCFIFQYKTSVDTLGDLSPSILSMHNHCHILLQIQYLEIRTESSFFPFTHDVADDDSHDHPLHPTDRCLFSVSWAQTSEQTPRGGNCAHASRIFRHACSNSSSHY